MRIPASRVLIMATYEPCAKIHGLSPLSNTGRMSDLYNLTFGRRSERLHHYPAFDGQGLRKTGPF